MKPLVLAVSSSVRVIHVDWDAVLQAKALSEMNLCGHAAMIYGAITNDKAKPLTKQLMDDYAATHASTIVA